MEITPRISAHAKFVEYDIPESRRMSIIGGEYMLDRIGRAKSELAQAESILRSAESELKDINTMLEERWAEKRGLNTKIKSAASAGQFEDLVKMQARTAELDRSISELGRSGAKCLRRIESAKTYVETLIVKLENLRQAAENLQQRIERNTKSLTAPLKLSRVKVQIEAIKGKEK